MHAFLNGNKKYNIFKIIIIRKTKKNLISELYEEYGFNLGSCEF